MSEETEDVKVLKSDLTRDTYEIDTARYPNKGKVLIFNNINFDNGLADRIGSDQDASTMYQRFSDLGFEPSLYTDKKHDEIMEILKGGQIFCLYFVILVLCKSCVSCCVKCALFV